MGAGRKTGWRKRASTPRNGGGRGPYPQRNSSRLGGPFPLVLGPTTTEGEERARGRRRLGPRSGLRSSAGRRRQPSGTASGAAGLAVGGPFRPSATQGGARRSIARSSGLPLACRTGVHELCRLGAPQVALAAVPWTRCDELRLGRRESPHAADVVAPLLGSPERLRRAQMADAASAPCRVSVGELVALGATHGHQRAAPNFRRTQSNGEARERSRSPSGRTKFGRFGRNSTVAPSSRARWNHLALTRAGTRKTANSARGASSRNGRIALHGGLQNTRSPSHGIGQSCVDERCSNPFPGSDAPSNVNANRRCNSWKSSGEVRQFWRRFPA